MVRFNKTAMSLLLILSVTLVYQCTVKSRVTSSEGKSDFSEINDFSYNTDSTFFVVEQKDVDNIGLPSAFVVIKSINSDTLFDSNKEYYFLKWNNDYEVHMRKRTTLPDVNTKSELDKIEPINNEYYFNVNTLEIKSIQINPKK